jgi:hypothetical protein
MDWLKYLSFLFTKPTEKDKIIFRAIKNWYWLQKEIYWIVFSKVKGKQIKVVDYFSFQWTEYWNFNRNSSFESKIKNFLSKDKDLYAFFKTKEDFLEEDFKSLSEQFIEENKDLIKDFDEYLLRKSINPLEKDSKKNKQNSDKNKNLQKQNILTDKEKKSIFEIFIKYYISFLYLEYKLVKLWELASSKPINFISVWAYIFWQGKKAMYPEVFTYKNTYRDDFETKYNTLKSNLENLVFFWFFQNLEKIYKDIKNEIDTKKVKKHILKIENDLLLDLYSPFAYFRKQYGVKEIIKSICLMLIIVFLLFLICKFVYDFGLKLEEKLINLIYG